MIRDEGVNIPIAIHVTERDRGGIIADCRGTIGPEAARAIAEQHADGIVASIGDESVEAAIAVHVAKRDRGGIIADRYWRASGGCEAAGAIAEQHADVAAAEVCNESVEVAIAIHVAKRD